jgi:hypothetical protein
MIAISAMIADIAKIAPTAIGVIVAMFVPIA